MLKQSFSRIKKVLTILLAFLFVVALTAATKNAESIIYQLNMTWRLNYA